VTGRQQPFGQRTADEAGATGNEVSQLPSDAVQRPIEAKIDSK
jgi:hypothetical protein